MGVRTKKRFVKLTVPHSQALAEEHAAEVRRLSARHDEQLAEVVLRLASAERNAESAASAASLQSSRRIAELEASRAEVERRALELAQSVGALTAEAGATRKALARAEAARAAAALERDQLRVRVKDLERSLIAKQQQQQDKGASDVSPGSPLARGEQQQQSLWGRRQVWRWPGSPEEPPGP